MFFFVISVTLYILITTNVQYFNCTTIVDQYYIPYFLEIFSPSNFICTWIGSTLPRRLNIIIFALELLCSLCIHSTNITCVYISAHLLSQLAMADDRCKIKREALCGFKLKKLPIEKLQESFRLMKPVYATGGSKKISCKPFLKKESSWCR